MSVEKSWIKHFAIPEGKLAEIQGKVPEGQSLLWYCIAQGVVKESDYLDWASQRYEVPRIQRDFFTRPLDEDFRGSSFSLFNWTPDFQPLGQWENNIYVACLQPNDEVQIEGYNLIYVVSPVSGLSLLWAQANNQNVIDPSELTSTTSQQISVSSEHNLAKPPILTEEEGSEGGLAQNTVHEAEVRDHISQIDVSNESIEMINNNNVNSFEPREHEKGQDAHTEKANQPLDLLAEQEKLEAQKAQEKPQESKVSEAPEGLSSIQADEIKIDTNQPEGLVIPPTQASENKEVTSEPEADSSEDAPAGLNLTQFDGETKEQAIQSKENQPQDESTQETPVDSLEARESNATDVQAQPETLTSPPPIISEENVENIDEPEESPEALSNESEDENDLSASTVTRLETPIDETKTNVPLPPSPKSEWDFQEVTAITSLRSIEATNHTNTLEFTDMYNDDTRPVCAPMTEKEIDACPANFDQAQSFDDVAGISFKKMAIHFQKSMLLVFHQNQLIPWRWTSRWQYKGAKAPAAIDLTKPSFLRVAFNTLLPYHGYICNSQVNDLFCQDWYDSKNPKHISALPITINGNVAGLIVGATDNTDILDYKYSLHFMQELAEQISKAYQKIKIKEAS